MFRLDEERVVDATLSGGLARYINHSCNPNCVTEIVEVDREFRIIIFAKRRINRGEEVKSLIESFVRTTSVTNFGIFHICLFYSCHTTINSTLKTMATRSRACAAHQTAANG